MFTNTFWPVLVNQSFSTSSSWPVLVDRSLCSSHWCRPVIRILIALSLSSSHYNPWCPVLFSSPWCRPVITILVALSLSSSHYSTCCPVLEFQSLQSLFPCPRVPDITILVALSLSSSHYSTSCPVLEFQSLQSLFPCPWDSVLGAVQSLQSLLPCPWVPVITILVALSLSSSHYNPFCPVLEFQSLQSLLPCPWVPVITVLISLFLFSSPWCRAVIKILVVLSLCSSPWCHPVNKVLVALSLSSSHCNPCCPGPTDQSSLPGAVFITGQRSARMAWVYVVNGAASALWSAIWYGLHLWTLKEMCTNLPKAKELGNRQVPFTILSCFNRHVQVYFIAFIY